MRRGAWVLAAVAAGGAGWAAAELARPRPTDIRVFDPDEVARLETAMWRSYYDRRRLPLFGQLVALLQGQFHLQPLRAVTLAGLAARAAAVFQVGASSADYGRALPYLERYYHGIRAVSEVPFDPRRAAWLELEWWIVHREVGVLEDDWDRIEAVLWVAWKALADEVSLVRLEEQEAREA